MSKFSHSSLSRDLRGQYRNAASRKGRLSNTQTSSSGFGQLGQSSGHFTSLVGLGPTSTLGPRGSRDMLSSGSSSQNLSSLFSLGGRGPPPLSSPPSRDPDQASKILASFGLSSSDLDELSRYPEEKITAENLPQIIQHLKRRRAENLAQLRGERLSRETLRPSPNGWDDLRPFRREHFDDRPSSLNPVVGHDHGSRSREIPYRERLDMEEQLRNRERLREESFLSKPPFRKLESDYDRLRYIQTQERSKFERSRGMPSRRNIDDFHGFVPREYPYLCTLCDTPCNSVKSWKEHINGGHHRNQCLLLLEQFPELAKPKMADSYMRQRSAIPAAEHMRRRPPPMSMRSGPDGRQRNFRGRLGDEDLRGPRQMPRKMGNSRVVNVMNFPRGKNLRFQLQKLAKPFGTVTGCLILNKKNEAFIEMSTPEEALAVIDHYSNNPALVFGKPIQIYQSQKYQQIKKPEGPAEQKGQPARTATQKQNGKRFGKAAQRQKGKSEVGRVVFLAGLPKSKYSDGAILKLAESYGKVNTHILMRMKKQAFIEMERAEDAQNMIDQCQKTPLLFRGKQIKVSLSQRYMKLVLKFPKAPKKQNTDRKRTHSPDQKIGGKAKKVKTEKSEADDDNSSPVVTTEDNDLTTEETDQDLVSASCDPELVEETEEEEATSCMETSDLVGDEAVGDLNQKEMIKNSGEVLGLLTSTPAVGESKQKSQSFHKNMDDFFALDEVEDMEDMDGHKIKFEDSEITENEIIDYELGPYHPNSPVGVEFVIPKTGFYCKLCFMFYTSEEVAKVTHCSSLAHYQKLKKLLNKMTKTAEKEN